MLYINNTKDIDKTTKTKGANTTLALDSSAGEVVEDGGEEEVEEGEGTKASGGAKFHVNLIHF